VKRIKHKKGGRRRLFLWYNRAGGNCRRCFKQYVPRRGHGHAVVRLSSDAIAVGAMPFAAAGGEYKFFGQFVAHAKHGERFEIVKCELPPPVAKTKSRRSSAAWSFFADIFHEAPRSLVLFIAAWYNSYYYDYHAYGVYKGT
jgi:hypothetical protein